MPTPLTMNLPKPKNWQEFEAIVCDAYSTKWGSNLTMNGRSGQKQYGIDIYGFDDLGRQIGIQCKCYKKQISTSLIEQELQASDESDIPITTLYIATTNDYDQNLQAGARRLSESRAIEKKSSIGILFWDDIVRALSLNPQVWSNHYSGVPLPTPVGNIAPERLLAAIEIGFYGAKLPQYLDLILGEFGWLAQEDPDQAFVMLGVIKQSAIKLLSRDDAAPFIEASIQIEEILKSSGHLSAQQSESIYLLAKRVASRSYSIDTYLSLHEQKFRGLATFLSSIHVGLEDVSEDQISRALKMLISCFPDSQSEIIQFLKGSELNTYSSSWPIRVVTFVERKIKYG